MFDGYVLVGGKSSRMGTNKASLRLGNQTFAERAVSALREIAFENVFFITGAMQDDEANRLLPADILRIADTLPNRAALGGIYTALAHSHNEWTAILACDFPFVTKDLFVRFAELAKKSDGKIAAVVPIQSDGRAQPLCALYRTRDCLKITEKLMKSDEIYPARRLAERVKTYRARFDEINDLPGSENFFRNVNTQADYLQAQNIFQQISRL